MKTKKKRLPISTISAFGMRIDLTPDNQHPHPPPYPKDDRVVVKIINKVGDEVMKEYAE